DCDDEPEDLDHFADEDGCPEDDNDLDGILDAVDQCPDELEDKDRFADDDGCPDLDDDGDTVPDLDDMCPLDFENLNGFEDGDGCSDELPKAIKQFTGVIKGITFETDSDVIVKSSFKVL